jgi:hypothetical protein
MDFPIEILENIFKYTDPITILSFQLKTNILSKFFVKQYTKDIYKYLDDKIINNSMDKNYIFINFLEKIFTKSIFKDYVLNKLLRGTVKTTFNELSYNNYAVCKNIDTYSSNFKEIIELNYDIQSNYDKQCDKQLKYDIKYDKQLKYDKKDKKLKYYNPGKEINFKDKEIEYKPINFNDFLEKRNNEFKDF